ncbi:hypothetical protein D0Y50_01610 [Salinimonas sediminis]|uniref:Uncharacterized protein n=1 Tax=Salinimonas sediminis TaxID=2303538 RepID=A0A346NI23_9ALTE|nr:hypothetical protein D0Y50_01610 [Salinimonas sediminis]
MADIGLSLAVLELGPLVWAISVNPLLNWLTLSAAAEKILTGIDVRLTKAAAQRRAPILLPLYSYRMRSGLIFNSK